MSGNNYKEDFMNLDGVLALANEALEKPEIYLEAPEGKCEELKKGLKFLYDAAFKVKQSSGLSCSQALPELIIDGFDDEQIWQQIDAVNEEIFSCTNLEKIARLMTQKHDGPLPFPFNNSENQNENDSDAEDEEDDDDDDDDEKDGASDFGKSEDSISESEQNFLDNDGDKKMSKKQAVGKPKKKKRKTEVDDKFFKLDELDEFLKIQDRKESNASKKKEDSSDEESIDLFKNFSESDDEEDDQEDENKKSLKYADFFDAPESDDHMSTEEIEKDNDDMDDDDEFDESYHERSEMIPEGIPARDKKQVKFNLLNNSGESDESDDSSENGPASKSQSKSSLELREERLKKKIKELEEKAISEKPWNQKGEVDASSRPPNSALEEILDFTSVTRPAPVMTEKTSMKLEDIIKGRIKDKAWDDVEKKFKPVETPIEYKKKLILNQEKSKESLAQIYENEYLQQREALTSGDKDEQEKEEPPEHIEIKKNVFSLFRKLDALSNYHYTPKPAKPEIKIVSNLPAISMEEVAPVATSDATLLAPEEVKSKQKGELIGKSERTKTDMKRERRKKKLKQHIRALNQSKKLTDNVKQKKSVKNKLESKKLTGRNIINTDETNVKDGKSLKSSTAFFAQLQDQVENSIKSKTKSTTNFKKSKNAKSAVKLKL